MLGLLKYDPPAQTEADALPTAEPLSQPWNETPGGPSPESGEFEMVVGRRQLASWLFVMVVVAGGASAISYLVGKSVSQKTPAAPAVVVPAAAPVVASVVSPTRAEIKSPPVVAPIMADPEAGKVYLQIGAVQRGMAVILAEGLRSHGFQAFVAPGPSENIFRVLIGPLPDPESFLRAKAEVDMIDLSTFARKYVK